MAQNPDLAPGGAEVWKVGSDRYLAYAVPTTQPPVYMTWKVRDDKAWQAHVPEGGSLGVDRTLTREQFRSTGALDFGFSDELRNFNDHPFTEFEADFEAEAQVQPWLREPDVLAIYTSAILEGRTPTQAELATTEFWQTHSKAERDWMVLKATDPRSARVQEADYRRAVTRALREAGVSDAPEGVVNLLAGRWVSGRWSESMVTDQIRGLADPYGGVELAPEVVEAGRGFDPTKGDAAAVAGGPDAIRQRIRDIFESPMRQVSIATEDEDEDTRLDRLVAEVEGGRGIDDIRRSVDRLAGLNPLTGRDITREGEQDVRALATRWLGPVAGDWSDQRVREWAGRLRNDPDAEQELVGLLQQQRLALLPKYTNENLTYEDIVTPVRNLATRIWNQPIQDETMLLDLANMDSFSEMEEKLYRDGLRKGVASVRQQFEQDVLAATGGSVRQSMV